MTRCTALVVATFALAGTAALAAPQEEEFIPEEGRINIQDHYDPVEHVSVQGVAAGVVAAIGLAFLLREVLRRPGVRKRRPAAR